MIVPKVLLEKTSNAQILYCSQLNLVPATVTKSQNKCPRRTTLNLKFGGRGFATSSIAAVHHPLAVVAAPVVVGEAPCVHWAGMGWSAQGVTEWSIMVMILSGRVAGSHSSEGMKGRGFRRVVWSTGLPSPCGMGMPLMACSTYFPVYM